MSAIMGIFWRLCLFRADPSVFVTAPPGFLYGLLIPYFVLALLFHYLLAVNPDASSLSALVYSLCSLLVHLGCIQLCLQLKQLKARFFAVASSYLAADITITSLFLPFTLIFLMFPEVELVKALFGLVYQLILLWWFCIFGFILQKSLNISLLLGVMISFTTFLASEFVSHQFNSAFL